MAIDSDPGLTAAEKASKRQAVLASFTQTSSSIPHPIPSLLQGNGNGSIVSPLARPFYPPSDTVESVVGKFTYFTTAKPPFPLPLETWLFSSNAGIISMS